MKQTIFSNSQFDLFFSIEPYTLALRSAFGTSHSSTTTRKNALVTFHFVNKFQEHSYKGFGEAGLPPKKIPIYLANYDDVEEVCLAYAHHLENFFQQDIFSNPQHIHWKTLLHHSDQNMYDPFDQLSHLSHLKPVNYFSEQIVTLEKALPLILLFVLDFHLFDLKTHKPFDKYSRVAKSAIEMAIFDLWGQMLHKPLYSLLQLPNPSSKQAFYTVALNEDVSKMIETLHFGLQYTWCIKVKLDDQIEKGIQIMKQIFNSCLSVCGSLHFKLSIDTNAAFTPALSLQFLQQLELQLPEVFPVFYMLEQPFPVREFTAEEAKEWQQVKEKYNEKGVLVFADESIATFEDVLAFLPFINGVNVKLEKAGGIRGVIHALECAEHHKLKSWIGCMVGSRLNSSCGAHLLALTEVGGDLDGSLLTTEESQIHSGGFQMIQHGHIKFHDSDFGVGVKLK